MLSKRLKNKRIRHTTPYSGVAFSFSQRRTDRVLLHRRWYSYGIDCQAFIAIVFVTVYPTCVSLPGIAERISTMVPILNVAMVQSRST